MGSVHAGFVEVLERTVTALVPRVFARGNGFESFPRIDIQTDRHVDFLDARARVGPVGALGA